MTRSTSTALVPELVVTDIVRSLAFWCGLVGFEVRYDRPEEGFAYLGLGGADVMLDEYRPGSRYWLTRPYEPPLGNGMNLQIEVDAVAPIHDRLAAAGWPLVMSVEDAWYRRGDEEVGQRQFVVAEPDGYLLRLAEPLGVRPASTVRYPPFSSS